MCDDPVPDIEYTLVRTVDSRRHIATFVRYSDDSGVILHGEHCERSEFNRQGLLDRWRLLLDVGWTVEDRVENVDIHRADRPSCGCKSFDYDKIFELKKAGLPIDEVNRKWREYSRPIFDLNDRILWGG